MVSLTLFGAFRTRVRVSNADISDQWTFTALLFDAMMLYWFSAMIVKSIGFAAQQVCEACMSQFSGISNEGKKKV